MANISHKPTEATRAQVESLSAYGIRQDEIATHLGIDPKTLRKHYATQLAGGTLKANTAVARSLHKMATEGGNVAAAIFWLKVRAGWTERTVLDVSHHYEDDARKVREGLLPEFTAGDTAEAPRAVQ